MDLTYYIDAESDCDDRWFGVNIQEARFHGVGEYALECEYCDPSLSCVANCAQADACGISMGYHAYYTNYSCTVTIERADADGVLGSVSCSGEYQESHEPFGHSAGSFTGTFGYAPSQCIDAE
ncbi:MAG: hypothetical protein IV100_26545 [Myxococcales bacterium]|nr:hypothetical protein [Myxococcales bacterium]